MTPRALRPRRISARWLPPLIVATGGLLLWGVHASLAGWEEVADLMAKANYEAAEERANTLALEEGAEGDERLWPILLERDPERALAALRQLASRSDLSEGLRVRLALEEASIALARGRFAEALTPLERVIGRTRGQLPGEVYLLAGMAERGLQRNQKSREDFASVRQDAAVFPWARLYLGQIALQEGDLELARRYFESAERSPLAARLPDLLVGIHDVLEGEGRTDEAAALSRDIAARFPQALATLPFASPEQELDLTLLTEAPVDSVPEAAMHGHLSVQLAAFSDRGRALAYLASWQTELPNLRLETEPGVEGQILYKVRSGQFVSRAQASTEVERLRRRYGLEAIVVESADAP
jgi:tetratricopeptide (TPR) repeat protein